MDIHVFDFDAKSASLPEGYHLVVVQDSQFDSTLLSEISASLAPRGFVLSVENISATPSTTQLKPLGLQVVAVTENNNKKYFLMKKVT